jgi:hypothetical protein
VEPPGAPPDPDFPLLRRADKIDDKVDAPLGLLCVFTTSPGLIAIELYYVVSLVSLPPAEPLSSGVGMLDIFFFDCKTNAIDDKLVLEHIDNQSCPNNLVKDGSFFRGAFFVCVYIPV